MKSTRQISFAHDEDHELGRLAQVCSCIGLHGKMHPTSLGSINVRWQTQVALFRSINVGSSKTIENDIFTEF